MITKTQLRIMQLFVSQIARRFTLRGVGKELRMHQALAYRACKQLIKDKLIIPDDKNYVLNYKQNHQELAYFEYLRSKEFLNKPENKALSIFAEEVTARFSYNYFVFLIFGSAVEIAKPRDIDILFIIEKTKDIETAEKALYNISRNYVLNIHLIVV